MQTRSMTGRRWLRLAVQLCVLATPLVLGGCDLLNLYHHQYTDRFGVTHYGLTPSQVDDLRISDLAAQQQENQIHAKANATPSLPGYMGDPNSTLFDWSSVNASTGPNVQGLATGLGFIAGSSSPPSFCTPPCGTFIIPP